MDEYYEFQPSFYYENEFEYEENIYHTYKYCMEPTIQEILPYVWKMLACNVVFRLIISCSFVNRTFKNISSVAIGIFLMFILMKDTIQYLVIFIGFGIITLKICYFMFGNTYSYILGCLYFIYLTGNEFFFPIPSIWMEMRGIHMVITMKLLSLIFDVKKGIVKSMPNITDVISYLFCPSNLILGPFVSYNSHNNLLERPVRLFDMSWIVHSFIFTTLSIMFLLVSNCLASYYSSENYKWISAYQEALSFRSSHYFVSFLSSATLAVSGLKCEENGMTNQYKSYLVTRPHYIEFPRSLVQVVVYWNMPTHSWLKKYVFRVSKPLGNFMAVTLTYIVSSFLHGFNMKLAAVLLSLGCYTYVEYEFRNKLSNVIDACVQANPCKRCTHKYKSHLFVYLLNFAFSGLAIFHLAYLGCLMENVINSDDNESAIFEKWAQLGYASHIVTATIYIFHKLV